MTGKARQVLALEVWMHFNDLANSQVLILGAFEHTCKCHLVCDILGRYWETDLSEWWTWAWTSIIFCSFVFSVQEAKGDSVSSHSVVLLHIYLMTRFALSWSQELAIQPGLSMWETRINAMFASLPPLPTVWQEAALGCWMWKQTWALQYGIHLSLPLHSGSNFLLLISLMTDIVHGQVWWLRVFTYCLPSQPPRMGSRSQLRTSMRGHRLVFSNKNTLGVACIDLCLP